MKAWERTLVPPSATLREALSVIDRAGSKLALVVDEQRVLLGTLSDGDIRRGLLRGMELSDTVDKAMHRTPACARAGDRRQTILSMMRRFMVYQVPILDARGMVVGLGMVDDFLGTHERENWVVIMAGGLGSRLKELTHHTPKPMLKVGSQPILETIVRTFIEHGFRRFYLAVNYKAEVIEEHFGDGSSLGAEILYLREQSRMGTAGALSLMPDAPSAPIIVTNADLLTRPDYGEMMDHHIESGADATMAVRDYEMQVPFGVVYSRDGRIEMIEEKPIQRFVVSAGINVLSPQSVALVPKDEFFDMPSLYQLMSAKGMRTRCHSVDGYWLDIGQLPDFERANRDFDEVFK